MHILWQISMAIDGEQSTGYVLITCCENEEYLALLMQVGALQRRKSGISGHSEHYVCLWGDFQFKVLLKAVDNYVI